MDLCPSEDSKNDANDVVVQDWYLAVILERGCSSLMGHPAIEHVVRSMAIISLDAKQMRPLCYCFQRILNKFLSNSLAALYRKFFSFWFRFQ